ncbi:MAG: hypothetical protein RIT81_04055 [Deltaproteobacteria bacterium]
MRSRLEAAILDRLVPGSDERYALPDDAMPYLAMLYQRVAKLPTARGELFRALQIEIALEETLGSPTAAARLADLRGLVPDTLDGVRTRLRRLDTRANPIDRMRRFLRSQGQKVVLRAPRITGSPGGKNPWPSKSNPNPNASRSRRPSVPRG